MMRRRPWLRRLALGLAVAAGAACAAPLQPAPTVVPVPPGETRPAGRVVLGVDRPTVGVAFGGGSARGLAHVGVIRWLEEHRIPIDVAAGTSMGGLVGGAFATGMDADELQTFVAGLDWDALFNTSTFAYKNIRRKADARAFPSRLEFGLKRGIVAPPSLNTGEAVELLFGRLAAPYFEVTDFDRLPTPFRTVAVDLVSARPVVMHAGSLADAMRATMSLPLIFPPVEIDGRVLIDGGTMNNVPADVVKAMGADRVIAINVSDLSHPDGISHTMLGLAGAALDAMLRASTEHAIASADIVINVPLRQFGSLDWRRASDLIDAGYQAAEAMRDQLLPLAVTEPTFETWQQGRRARRLSHLPPPAFVSLEGFAANDMRRLETLLARHVGVPIEIDAIEADLAIVSGLDRYETIVWSLVRDEARGTGLHVRGRAKSYAPPFLMLGVNLENTTSSDFRVTATVRYLAFDIVGSGSELRVDGTIGSDPGIGVELYKPIGPTPLFVAPYAGVNAAGFDLIDEEATIARYRQTKTRAGLNIGVNVGARSDVRVGAYVGRQDTSLEVGIPGFPEVRGKDAAAELVWRVDTQDSPVVPTTGVLSRVSLSHTFDGPDVVIAGIRAGNSTELTQLAATANRFWSVAARNRLFLYGGLGTSFDRNPIATQEFSLGSPFRLGAYRTGELRGAHYYVVTGGYLRQIARLPDFIGGPVFVGGWMDNGDAFEEWSQARWRTNGSAGLIMDTLVGPVMIAGSWGYDGRWRTYLGIGRLFR